MASSSSQSWPLSQTANKNSGICSICQATRQLHLKDGTIHRHGPRDNPCLGSDRPPLGPSMLVTPATGLGNSAPMVSGVSSNPSGEGLSQTQQPTDQSCWVPDEVGVIKHIPKSARCSCANHLAGIL